MSIGFNILCSGIVLIVVSMIIISFLDGRVHVPDGFKLVILVSLILGTIALPMGSILSIWGV